jgi:hypothetical protein
LTADKAGRGAGAHHAHVEPSPLPSEASQRRAARLATPRIQRELRTVAAMLRITCRDLHRDAASARGDAGLCAECADLLDYARKRLACCPFGPEKPTCVNCRIHCYGPAQREAMRAVMRHAGPRMLYQHPWLAIAHVVDGWRAAPPKPRGVGGKP